MESTAVHEARGSATACGLHAGCMHVGVTCAPVSHALQDCLALAAIFATTDSVAVLQVLAPAACPFLQRQSPMQTAKMASIPACPCALRGSLPGSNSSLHQSSIGTYYRVNCGTGVGAGPRAAALQPGLRRGRRQRCYYSCPAAHRAGAARQRRSIMEALEDNLQDLGPCMQSAH